MQNLVGQTLLNRYQVLEPVGRGGMAEVYKVWDAERSVHLAMKMLHEELAIDRVFLRRFRREAQTLAQLQHPNIVRFYGFEHDRDLAFMLLDFVDGRSLKRVIYDQGGPLPFGRVLTISQQVLSALGYAHNKGFVHADIKPGNILVDGQGIAYVTDFGIARMTDSATMTMAGAGTPAYMAPEAIRGLAPVPAVDQYGWGVVLFEMLTGGERPFTGERATLTGTAGEKVRWEHLNLAPPPMARWNPDVTPELEAVVGRCLAKEPEERFPGVQDLLAALSEAGAGMPEEEFAEETLSPEVMPEVAPRRKKVGLWVALAAVVVAALGWGAVSLMGGGAEEAAAAPALETAAASTVETDEAAVTMATAVPPTATTAPTAMPTETLMPTPAFEAGDMMISPVDGMELMYIPVGSFLMGSEDGNLGEQPVHEVYLDAYWMDRTEVTNAMYASCVEAGACEAPRDSSSRTFNRYFGNSAFNDYPVIYVSWFDAEDYCSWAGRRLPTEAEWERAARGSDGFLWPWGYDEPITCSQANVRECAGDVRAVGSREESASPYGVYDMVGNVWEWVADWYGGDTYNWSLSLNPTGPLSGSRRVFRGASFSEHYIEDIRPTHRSCNIPETARDGIGFRCALSVGE